MCVRLGGCGSVASETVEGEAERLGLAERNAEGKRRGRLRGADPNGLQSRRLPLVVDGSGSFAVFGFCRLPPGRLRVMCARLGGCGSVASDTLEVRPKGWGWPKGTQEAKEGTTATLHPVGLRSRRAPLVVDGSRSFAVFCFCRLPPGRLRVMCVRLGGRGSVASETVEGEAERLGLAERNAEGERRGDCGERIPMAFNPGFPTDRRRLPFFRGLLFFSAIPPFPGCFSACLSAGRRCRRSRAFACLSDTPARCGRNSRTSGGRRCPWRQRGHR
jgi:uncharacterized protein YceK